VTLLADLETDSFPRRSADRKAVFRRNDQPAYRPETARVKAKRQLPLEDPFGRRTKVSGSIDCDFGFTGHYWHATSGLYLSPTRAYDPNLGRWISRDPSGESSGINLYAYCSGNPISLTDPTGLTDFVPMPGAPDFLMDPNWFPPETYSNVFTPMGPDPSFSCMDGPPMTNPLNDSNDDDPLSDLRNDLSKLLSNIWDALTNQIQNDPGPLGGSSLGPNLVAILSALFPEGRVTEEGIGIIAQDGTTITGFTGHGVQRAIGDSADRAGTTPQAILDALKNPNKIVEGVDSQGRPFKIYTGQDARVVINPQTGKVVSVNPRSGAGANK
jgi:RHS repeat-associated protein